MSELHLRVYENRSELVYSNGEIETFSEGKPSKEASRRYRSIEDALGKGFLKDEIELCQTGGGLGTELQQLEERDFSLISGLVNALTSEVGRALVGLTVLQLAVKAIEPEQNIRLHKGNNAGNNFSWREGISMRSLDKKFITPTLRQYGLLRQNRDGFMMTRSLAENYPYTMVYKAQMRGAKEEWVELVERIEGRQVNPQIGLRLLITLLMNKVQEFVNLAEQMLVKVDDFLGEADEDDILNLILKHINSSNHAARIMEIAMHSFMQVLLDFGALEGAELVPLSQMRSANKKHGNIGDIEIAFGEQIIESWDAKYGKSYLRDEIEELEEKLPQHSEVKIAGFVTSMEPDRMEELQTRIDEIGYYHSVAVRVVTLEEWIQSKLELVTNLEIASQLDVLKTWLLFYAQSLSQKRRELAPIDEPCLEWVRALDLLLESHI